MAQDPYVYPGSGVLRNNLEIHDQQELSRAEADIVRTFLTILGGSPLPGGYDLTHWQAFHRRIFGWLYPWAGELRTVQIAKPNAFYARPERIERYAQGIFAELAREDYLKGLDRDALLERLTHYHAEMYAVHPFREGNTRSLRAFLGQLAGEAGHRIAWEHLDHKRSFAANVRSLNGHNDQLRTLLDDVPAEIELHAAVAQLALYAADWETVVRSSDASAELSEREGLIGKLCLPYALRGRLQWRSGEWQASESSYRRAHELAEQIGWSEVCFDALYGLSTHSATRASSWARRPHSRRRLTSASAPG